MHNHKELLLDLIDVREYTNMRKVQMYKRVNRESDIPKELVKELEELNKLKEKVEELDG